MNKTTTIGTTLAVVFLAILAFFAYGFRTREVPTQQVDRNAAYFNEPGNFVYEKVEDSDKKDEVVLSNLKEFSGIWYSPELGAPTNEKVDVGTWEMELSEENPEWLKTKISPTSKEYYITYDAGPSGDPHYEFYIKQAVLDPERKTFFEYVGSVPTGLVIQGNGFLYTKARYNEYFETSRKYKADAKGHIIEVPQATYSIGLKTKTNWEIKLFGQNKDDIVATIAKGSPIEVILYEPRTDSEGELFEDRYLIKTQNGITGWILKNDVKSEQCMLANGKITSPNTAIDGICFLGD